MVQKHHVDGKLQFNSLNMTHSITLLASLELTFLRCELVR
jgi:hypothetical protein